MDFYNHQILPDLDGLMMINPPSNEPGGHPKTSQVVVTGVSPPNLTIQFLEYWLGEHVFFWTPDDCNDIFIYIYIYPRSLELKFAEACKGS